MSRNISFFTSDGRKDPAPKCCLRNIKVVDNELKIIFMFTVAPLSETFRSNSYD
jgi:hypothetical protein